MTMLARSTAALLPMVLFSWAALADPVAGLTGYWRGTGSISLGNGKTERVKCSVTYRTAGSTQVRQALRCASADYSINSVAELSIKGGQVSGTWEERTYSARGDVTGRFGGESFSLKIQGANFSAAMNVTLASCKQSLSIMPQGLEVTRVSINLAKERCGG